MLPSLTRSAGGTSSVKTGQERHFSGVADDPLDLWHGCSHLIDQRPELLKEGMGQGLIAGEAKPVVVRGPFARNQGIHQARPICGDAGRERHMIGEGLLPGTKCRVEPSVTFVSMADDADQRERRAVLSHEDDDAVVVPPASRTPAG